MSENTDVQLTHGGQMKGEEFKASLRKPGTWVWLVLLAGVGVLFGVMAGSVPASVGLFVALPLFALLVIWFMAGQRSEDTFFASYADSHGLKRIADRELPEASPLLRHANRKTIQFMEGRLDESTSGALSLFQYTVNSEDLVGDGTTSEDFPFTLILVDVPETVAALGDVYVRDQAAYEVLRGLEEIHQEGFEKLSLESQALEDRYEILVRGGDPVVIRQTFSPVFIEWMTNVPEAGFAFELESGVLCVYAKGHRESVGELDDFKAKGLDVVTRIREEMATKA